MEGWKPEPEEWRDVPGFENRYQVSDLGRVASCRFRGNGDRQIMKPTPNHAGYMVVSLRRRQYRVHVLVLTVFKGQCPAGMEGCHNDNRPANNRLDNLRWDTPKGNIADRRDYHGEANPNAKLTDAQREEVVILRQSGMSTREVGAVFGISGVRVSQICSATAKEGATSK